MTHATLDAAFEADETAEDAALLTEATTDEAAADAEVAAEEEGATRSERYCQFSSVLVGAHPGAPHLTTHLPEDAAAEDAAALVAEPEAAGALMVTPTAAHDWTPNATPAEASDADCSHTKCQHSARARAFAPSTRHQLTHVVWRQVEKAVWNGTFVQRHVRSVGPHAGADASDEVKQVVAQAESYKSKRVS